MILKILCGELLADFRQFAIQERGNYADWYGGRTRKWKPGLLVVAFIKSILPHLVVQCFPRYIKSFHYILDASPGCDQGLFYQAALETVNLTGQAAGIFFLGT